jgi:dipeptidyl-peptidase-3
MERQYTLEKIQLGNVGPVRIVQLYADGFESLATGEKIFSYHLSMAAIAARDIAVDQSHRDALEIRDILEALYTYPNGIDPDLFRQIEVYTKLFWINNGMYDHITSSKFIPEFSFKQFSAAAASAVENGAVIKYRTGETLSGLLKRLRPVMFDPSIDPVRTNKTPGEDFIKGSANNYYEGVSFSELEEWSRGGKEHHPLNSKVVKRNGEITEEVYRTGTIDIGGNIPPGRYASDLHAAILHLEKAKEFACTPHQGETIDRLITYYRTGDPEDWRRFNISWCADTEPRIEFIHGFIEVYLDPRGAKGEFESVISFADPLLTEAVKKIGDHAQYFEDRLPWEKRYKKTNVRPLKASVINVIIGTGGSGPLSAIGINLPNEQKIREQYGSKSVSLNNIVDAYDKSSGKDVLREFAFDEKEISLGERYGMMTNNLHTALHEVLGHGSGKLNPVMTLDPHLALPGYYSTIEEARADLVALWHIWDEKLIELGIIPNAEIPVVMYNKEVLNGMMLQLQRVPPGHDRLEEDHMKDHQLIAHWLFKNAGCIARVSRDGKTYFHVTDYQKMREGVGRLLSEMMRIKAEGDYKTAKDLVDTYGWKIDTDLRDEVLLRMEKLDRAVYTGFVMPRLVPVHEKSGTITDILVEYPLDLSKQMLEYSSMTCRHTVSR